MGETRLRWYDTFIYFVGVLVAVADPVTDVWTCVVFYRSGYFTWFGVGITFVVLPILLYPVVNYFTNCHQTLTFRENLKQFLYKLNPFAPAISRLLVFIVCCKHFKQMWSEGSIETIKSFPRRGDRKEKLVQVVIFGMTEATAESAPQFLIQLYAMTVQQEVETIQIISLAVSFLSLVWTVTKYEFHVYNCDDELPELDLKDRVIIFVCHFSLLGTRMLSVAFFTIIYKWWVLAVMVGHCLPTLVFASVGSHCAQVASLEKLLLFAGISWLSWFDFSFEEFTRKTRWVLQWLPYLMHIIENIFMVLAFYFKNETNLWYTLPVTIGICIVSPLSSSCKLFYSRVVLKKKLKQQRIQVELNFQRKETQERENSKTSVVSIGL